MNGYLYDISLKSIEAPTNTQAKYVEWMCEHTLNVWFAYDERQAYLLGKFLENSVNNTQGVENILGNAKTIVPAINAHLHFKPCDKKPRSKWHSASKSNLANHGPKPIPPTTTTNSKHTVSAAINLQQSPSIISLRRESDHLSKQTVQTITITTSTESPESIILMIQEPHYPLQTQYPPNTTVTTIPQMSNRNSPILNCTEPNKPTTSFANQQSLNCPNRTTVLKIPRQSSRPRIFLLTKPSKTPLVRKVISPIVHQKDLNLVTVPQSLEEKNGPKIAPRIIKIPFLTKSQNSVKINPLKLQTSREITKTPDQSQPLRDLKQIIAPSLLQTTKSELKSNESLIIKQEIIQYPQTNTKQSVKTPIQVNTVRQKPSSTLASMAGIELTGADMCPTSADMSGAMPPTATVEEINVPVFIDEYLQEAAISTLPATSTSNINNNNNNINYHHCLDTLENFEFDIELLTENKSKEQDKAVTAELPQTQLSADDIDYQPQTTTTTNTTDLLDHLIGNVIEEGTEMDTQNQQMLNDILGNQQQSYTNNNNNCADTCTDNVCNMATNFNDFLNMGNVNQFDFAPNSQNLNLYDDDDFDFSIFSPSIEDAVAIPNFDNENIDPFLNSQSESVMLPTNAPVLSQSSKFMPLTTRLSQDILEAEPQVASESTLYNIDPSICDIREEAAITTPNHYYVTNEDDNTMEDDVIETLEVLGDSCDSRNNPLKRSCSAQTQKHMQEKRIKLRLDTKRRNQVEENNELLDTPSIINIIDEMRADNSSEEPSTAIFSGIISNSPSDDCVALKSEIDECSRDQNFTCYSPAIGSSSIKSEIVYSDFSNDISPPFTPYSSNSNSILIKIDPPSPSSSIASTSASVTTKRGRGRPAKLHSDMPSISEIAHLPECERKKVLERAKNNEASRKSRLKNKERDMAIATEERDLTQRNSQLNMELETLQNIEKKLQQALKRRHT
ncbi:xrp1 [Haematobia irritans]|uniref:xrp1 n=1 Tax=Haematobia irritans TaxID=7368 RepID=UPI003F50C193